MWSWPGLAAAWGLAGHQLVRGETLYGGQGVSWWSVVNWRSVGGILFAVLSLSHLVRDE